MLANYSEGSFIVFKQGSQLYHSQLSTDIYIYRVAYTTINLQMISDAADIKYILY